MSLTGSGKFRSVYVDDFDRSSFSSSGRSGVFNPNGFGAVNGNNNNNDNGIISYEPGTGAEYMHSQGWHARDPHGKPLPITTTLNRVSMRNNNNSFGGGGGGGGVHFDSKNNDLLARENRSKLILLILLILVSLILIILIVVIISLFAAGVFTTQQAIESIPINPPVTLPPNADILVNRTFDCQMFIVDQANPLFDNQTSVEYQQAFLMLQNGLATMIQQSTLRDLQPLVAVTNLRNLNPDLQVEFLLSIIIPSRSPINASAIRNLFLSELQLLENQLNGSDIDRGRINVIMTSI